MQADLALIKEFFQDGNMPETELSSRIEARESTGEKDIYARLLFLMTHLRLKDQEAKDTWIQIQTHREQISNCLKRDPGFRVAMLDHFQNLRGTLKNPKVLEFNVYVETAKQAVVDELTGVYNRRYFDWAMRREIKQAERYKRSLSLLIIDIDNFKKINDTCGHMTGDVVLARLGEMLKRNVRSEDTICRLGGEEFGILFPDTDETGAGTVSEKIRSHFSMLAIQNLKLTLSGGSATFPSDAKNADELVSRADKSLYFAKYAGKDRIILYSENKRNSLRFPIRWSLEIEQEGKTKRIEGKSITKDISLEGISFEVDKPLVAGQNYRMRLETYDEILDLPVEIIWTDNKGDQRKYRAGARFLSTSPGTSDKLKWLLEK